MRYTAEKIGEIVAARYGAECVYLFGSCARGDADADSDIDLRIDNGTIRDLQMADLPPTCKMHWESPWIKSLLEA